MRGDHLRVYRFGYYHHGIDLGDGRVVHFTNESLLDPLTVSLTSLAEFAKSGTVEVVTYAGETRPRDLVCITALTALRHAEYRLLSNNCEHFASFCKTGRAESEQVRDSVERIGRTVRRSLTMNPAIALSAPLLELARRGAEGLWSLAKRAVAGAPAQTHVQPGEQFPAMFLEAWVVQDTTGRTLQWDGARWWVQTERGLLPWNGPVEPASHGNVFWRDEELRPFCGTGEAWYVAVDDRWAKLEDYPAAWDAAPRIPALTAAPPGVLNALLEAPASVEDLLRAMTEIGARAHVDWYTVRFLLQWAASGTPSASPDEQRAAARAWFTLGVAARFGAADSPADQFPWLTNLLHVVEDRRWPSTVRVGAVQAAGLLWRPSIRPLRDVLVLAANDPDADVARTARTVLTHLTAEKQGGA
ncbi:MAG: lecithin retinol acyltransferase family protein [Acidobacteriota bacterium]|nr:lecithin retinol acyltransferase family protein [Acidobacteriota bacterium]